MKKILAIAALMFVVLSSGCTQTSSVGKDTLISLMKQYDSIQNMRLAYDMQMGSGDIGTMDISTQQFKLGSSSKTMGSSSVMGIAFTFATYNDGQHQVTCTETMGEVSCSTDEEIIASSGISTDYDQLEAVLDKSEVTYLGEKTILNRPCYSFRIIITDFSSILGDVGSNDTDSRLEYSLCIDKQFGYTAETEMDVMTYSTLTGNYSMALQITANVTDFGQDVKESDVQIPFDFFVGETACDNNTVEFNVTSVSDRTSNIRVSATLEDENESIPYKQVNMMSVPLSAWKNKPINVTEMEDGLYTIEVCIDDNCQNSSAFCYSIPD